MDKLLLENYSLINKIKEEYNFLLKENKLLKEKIYTLENIGKDIITYIFNKYKDKKITFI
jgi:hypothetical protein